MNSYVSWLHYRMALAQIRFLRAIVSMSPDEREKFFKDMAPPKCDQVILDDTQRQSDLPVVPWPYHWSRQHTNLGIQYYLAQKNHQSNQEGGHEGFWVWTGGGIIRFKLANAAFLCAKDCELENDQFEIVERAPGYGGTWRIKARRNDG